MIIALRFLHVFAGVFWAGAVFFVVSFLMPSIRDAGPAGGAVMRQLVVVRKYPGYILGIAVVAVLSGIALYWQDISVTGGAFARSRAGMTYGVGAIAAVLTLVVGATILSPTAAKLGALTGAVQAGGGPPNAEQAAELGRLSARMTMGSRLAALLLAITLLTMAIGRYV